MIWFAQQTQDLKQISLADLHNQIKFHFIMLYPPYQNTISASINMGSIYTKWLLLNFCNTADRLKKNSNALGSHSLWISCMKLTNYLVLLNIRLVIILPHPNMTPYLFVPINLCVAMALHCTNLTHWGWAKMAAIFQTTFSIAFFE